VVELGWRAELAALTTEILGRYGVAGRVEVEGHLVWLIGHGPTVEVGLPELATTSAAQTPAELRRLAERLARDLASARRNAIGKSDSSPDWMGILKVFPAVLFVIVVGFAIRYLVPPSAPSKSPSRSVAGTSNRKTAISSDPDQERHDREYKSCLESVSRIQRGGSVTALDADGWVVELSLISESSNLDPSSTVLGEYFEPRPNDIEKKQVWTGAPLLLQLDSHGAGVLVSKEPLATAAPVMGSGIKITWRGQYASQYFKEAERREFIALADSLYRDTQSTYGALYARCAQGVARYLGAWFRGPNVGGAVWSLIAELDVFSDVPQLPGIKPGDGPEKWALALNRLASLTRSVTRKRAAFVIASSAGSVSEQPGKYATLEFPFAQGSRANTASQKFINVLTQMPSHAP